MKGKYLFVLLIILSSSYCFGEVLFVHHFDDVSSATPEERLVADYAKGNPQVYEYRQVDGKPDTTTVESKFGGASIKRNGLLVKGRDLASFHAKDNFNLQKGSVEGWVYLDVDDYYDTRWARMLRVEIPGEVAIYPTQPNYEMLEVLLNSEVWAIKATKRVDGTTNSWNLDDWRAEPEWEYIDPADELNIWVYISADWKLDSDNSSENFLRLWINGYCIGKVDGIPKFEYTPGEGTKLGIGGHNGSGETGIQGYFDECRITDSLITDMYTVINEYNDYDPPTSPFTAPAIQTCVEALKYDKWNMQADIFEDCHIDLDDINILAGQWLECVNPTDANCSSPWE